MDIPLIRRFDCGYEQGVKDANPTGPGDREHDRHHAAAWNDPVRGGELAKASSTAVPTSSTRPPAAPASASADAVDQGYSVQEDHA